MFQPFVVTPDRDPRNAASPSLVLKGVHNGKQLLDLTKEHGAVLLRNYPRSSNPLHFSAFVQALGLHAFDGSESAAPRVKVSPHVYTANEAPPSALVPFHHEMAQCTTSPDYIFFFCERPAVAGGATPLVRSRDVADFVRARHPLAARELEERGIRYVRVLPAHDDPNSPIGRSWRSSYGSTRETSEENLARVGGEWEWIGGDENSLLRTVSAPRPFFGWDHKARQTFFNSAVAVHEGWRDARNDPRRSLVFGDGALLSDRSLRLLHDAAKYMHAHAWRKPWRAGDVLIVDNRQVLHAREKFVAPRRVLVSMWKEA